MADMLGIPANKLMNAPFTEFVHPDDRSAALAKYSRRVKGEAYGMVHDIRLLTANSGIRWFRVSGMRIQWEGQSATLNFVGDIHERKLAEERTLQLAYHDELTQLPNRRMFAERLEHSISSQSLQNRFICVMFIDVNKLKSLNDRHGHKAGDMLLIEVSKRLRLQAGEQTTVARLGGDEFVVLLPSLGHDYIQARQHAMQKAEQLQTALCAPYHLQSESSQEHTIVFHSSASIGVYVFDPHQAKADDILSKADAAMYRAKKEGQGVLFFDDKKAA
jgi:diguanylate cyclase (GGDEF)-like protein/PAS domain S-box-containing protein